MAGTPQVNIDKDGIFGRFLNIWDGTNFRRAKGDVSGNLSTVQLPVLNRIPIVIHSIPGMSFLSPVRGAGVFTDVVYTVPANTILHITKCLLLVAAGACGAMYNHATILGLVHFINFFPAVALNVPNISIANDYYDTGTVISMTTNVTAAGTQYYTQLQGFLIPKT